MIETSRLLDDELKNIGCARMIGTLRTRRRLGQSFKDQFDHDFDPAL